MSDMAELFFKDPLEMTDSDIDRIIEEMRSRRVAFKANPSAVKSQRKPKLTAKQEEVKKLAGDVDLDL